VARPFGAGHRPLAEVAGPATLTGLGEGRSASSLAEGPVGPAADPLAGS